jgi:hypothetical protein
MNHISIRGVFRVEVSRNYRVAYAGIGFETSST